jgi:hypothetical protein
MTMSGDKRSKLLAEMPDPNLPYEEQQKLALLKILELGQRNIEEGKTVPLSVAMKRFRARLRQRRHAK